MIQIPLTNEILKRISAIDENRFVVNRAELPAITRNRLRNDSRKANP